MEAIKPTIEQQMEQEGALMVKRVTDPKKVPAYFNGYKLRVINMTMLNGLARQYEGGLNIPGVEFYMDETLSVRA